MPDQTKPSIPLLDVAPVSLQEKNAALEVKYILEEICADLGFDHAIYAGLIPSGDEKGGYNFEAHTTYPMEWQKIYIERGYVLKDPRALRPFTSVRPIDWCEFKDDPAFVEIMDAAEPYNLPRTGMTLPIRGPSIGISSEGASGYAQLGVSKHVENRAEWDTIKRETMVALQEYVAEIYIVFSRYAAMSVADLPEAAKALSPKEGEILSLIAEGYSSTSAAQKLKRSERTVEVHLRAIRAKLQANSTAHAIAKAYKMGILSLSAITVTAQNNPVVSEILKSSAEIL